MTPFEQVLEFILTLQVWDVAKVFVCFTFLLYVIFAFVVLRQVNLMARTLAVPIDLSIKTAAWLHLGLAIVAFLLALMVL